MQQKYIHNRMIYQCFYFICKLQIKQATTCIDCTFPAARIPDRPRLNLTRLDRCHWMNRQLDPPSMLPRNSIRIIRSRLCPRLKLLPIQPTPVCDMFDLPGLVKVPGKTGFRSPYLHRVSTEREKYRVENGNRMVKTEIAPYYPVS